MKFFRIISYAVCLFFICLGISIVVNYKFGIVGDYLSAFSTLAAALIALYLYNDWREEHRLKLLEHYHSAIKERAYAVFLEINYILVEHPVIIAKADGPEELKRQIDLYLKNIDELAGNLTELCVLVNEYENFLTNLEDSSLVKEIIADVKEFSTDLNASFEYCIEILKDFKNLDPNSSENKKKIKFIWDTTLKIKIASSFRFSNFYIKYLNKSK